MRAILASLFLIFSAPIAFAQQVIDPNPGSKPPSAANSTPSPRAT